MVSVSATKDVFLISETFASLRKHLVNYTAIYIDRYYFIFLYNSYMKFTISTSSPLFILLIHTVILHSFNYMQA